MKSGRIIVWGSLLAVLVLAWLLGRSGGARATSMARPLLVYCAAGLKEPVEAVAREYERESGVRVQLQFGGSGSLLANLRVSRQGDLFIAADTSFIEAGRSNGLLAEVLPLARMTPVVVVPKGNPRGVDSVASLMKPGLRVSLANPDAAAIGAVTRAALMRSGQWAALAASATVFKPTVNDVANDVKLGSVDAGIVWDATAAQYPGLTAVKVPEFQGVTSEVAVAVLKSCGESVAALRFARYLAARDRGLPRFASAGFQPMDGDVWMREPEVVLYSGTVNRTAIEETLREFEVREGVRVTRVYNGCGILTAQIRSGQKPDAYFACDRSFMDTVASGFRPAVELAETSMVLVVRKGNPLGIRTLEDLTRPGLKVGLAQEQQSALGALSARLLRSRGWLDRVRPNVRVEAPTGDLLVNQMRGGGLDVAMVYAVNAVAVGDAVETVAVDDPLAVAVQPYAVGGGTSHGQLMQRLLDRLRSGESRQRFEKAGFRPKTP